ncbi:MAG: FAD-binding oxidoreductase [Solirubrobacterales bacterium]
MSDEGLKELGAKLAGDLVRPENAGWDEARQAWTLAVDQSPKAVAYVAGAEDVAAVVGHAGEHDLGVVTQGTGHGAGSLEWSDDVLLVKTERMNGIVVDADAERARAEAGLLWRDALNAAQEHGLVGLAGTSPDVGVVGYTLGGGLGWLGRRYGLACNSVHAVELVTADGEQRRVDAGSDPELFWALRGGGGGFGIVTAIEIDLYPLAEVYAGNLIFDGAGGREIFHRFREWAAATPDEVTSIARFLHPPPLPFVPEPLRDRLVVTLGVTFAGGESEGAEVIAPLREIGDPIMDTFGTIPAAELVGVHMDPEQPVPAAGFHNLIDELSEETVDAFVEAAGPDSGSPLLLAELRQLGGALSTPAPDGGALPSIDAPYVLNSIGSLMDPSAHPAITHQFDVLRDALAPWSTSGCYLNFAEQRAGFDTLFPAESCKRLSAVKERWDPGNVFRANYSFATT